MAFVFSVVAIGVVVTLLKYILACWQTHLQASRAGCRPPCKRASRDPFFNFDNFARDGRIRKEGKLLFANAKIFSELGVETYGTTSIAGDMIYTIDSENIYAIMSVKAQDWGVGPQREVSMGAFCGRGLLTTDGETWKQSRYMLKPSFIKSNISDLSAFGQFVDQLIDKIPHDGTALDLQPLVMTMFVDTSQHFLVGQAPGILGGDDIRNDSPVSGPKYLAAFNASCKSIGLRLLLGPARILLPKSMTTDHWQTVYKYVDFYIARALSKVDKKSSNQKVQHKSLVEGLAAQTDDRIEIRNQILHGMLAAQDTTPSLISNTLFVLAKYPLWWSRLREELIYIPDNLETVDLLRRNELLQDVLRESLRLYPVFPVMGRAALVTTTLPRGGGPDEESPIHINPGTRVVYNAYALNRKAAVFGEDADKFNPDRWKTISPSVWEFMPFGGGPRACLGQQKALNEASYLLWRLTRAFKRLESRDDRDWQGVQRIVCNNANGCKVACHVN